MKIVHLIAPAPAGGAESVVRSLAVGQQRVGQDVQVVVLLPPAVRSPLVEQLEGEGIPVTQVRQRPRAYLAEVRDVSDVLRRGRVALVHSHGFHADVVGYLATRRHPAAWVTTAHGFTGGDLKNRLYDVMATRLMRRSDAVIAVARNVRERLVGDGVAATRIHLVQNGYAAVGFLDRSGARKALGLEPEDHAVGWIGRLSEEKGPDLLLEALGVLRRDDLTVLFVGDGPEREVLERRAVARGMGARVRFAGQIDGAARYITAFDALVISSRTEGTPMVLLEAMVAGVPVVAFAVGGVPDVVDEGCAFLAAPGDVGGLAALLARALDHPEEARRRAVAAAEAFAARYSVETCVARLSDLYATVTRARPARQPQVASL